MTEQDFLPGKTGAFQETYGGGRKRRKVRMDLRLAMIACEVMVREVSFLTAQSEHIISVRWMKQGLHDNPSMLNRMLKEKIAEIEELNEQMSADKKFDAIVLGYGLCSNGVIGISTETLPLVIPKCDDCIALFLGSQSRYLELFRQYKGIYWYTPGWVERAFTPSPESYRRRLREYEETYGEENAAYLLEQENSWIANYRYGIFIDSPVCRRKDYAEYSKNAAESFGWSYLGVMGSMDYFTELLGGTWDSARFLVCPPGYVTEASYDESKIKAIPKH